MAFWKQECRQIWGEKPRPGGSEMRAAAFCPVLVQHLPLAPQNLPCSWQQQQNGNPNEHKDGQKVLQSV